MNEHPEYPDGPKWQKAPSVFGEPGSVNGGPWPRDMGPGTPPWLPPRPELPLERDVRRMSEAAGVVAACAVLLTIVIVVAIVVNMIR